MSGREDTGEPRPPVVGSHASILRSHLRCAACSTGTPPAASTHGDRPAHDPHHDGMLSSTTLILTTITHLFANRILGHDPRHTIAACLAQTGAGDGCDRRGPDTATPGHRADAVGVGADQPVDLAAVPPDRLRRLLDAFAIEIHYNPPGSVTRLAIKIGAPLWPGMRVEVPDGWPTLTQPAARALLRLLTHAEDRREHDTTMMRNLP